MMIEVPYEYGDLVYLRTDPDQRERMITGVIVRPTGLIYFLAYSNAPETQHYELEFSKEKNLVIS